MQVPASVAPPPDRAIPSPAESLLGGLLVGGDPERVREALAIATPADLADPLLARVAQAMLDLADRGDPIDLPTLHAAMSRESTGDAHRAAVRLAELADGAATGAHVLAHARAVHREALERRERLLAARLVEPATPDDLREVARRELGAIASELGAQEPRIRSYVELVPTREQLATLAAAPSIVPVATHVLYPGLTTVYAGQTGIGKTTSIVRVVVDLIYGREPWTGRHDGRDPMRALIVSKDDTTLSIVRKLAALAPDGAWMDGRVAIIGKEKRALPLDDHGVEVLGNTIADGRYDVFVIDPYQHFLPPGLTVNDDEGARLAIDQLDRIAESLGPSGVLIHHPRKRPPKAKPAAELTKGERMEEIRGSAVLAQLARSVATLWEIEPGVRMLDAVVNDVPPLSELYFATATHGDRVIRWELAGPPTCAEAEALRARLLDLESGSYTVTDLARHLFEIAPERKPSGKRRTDAKALARRIADELPDRFRLLPESGLEVL
ncbi:MAG: AAA family ATPase [Deltaproteobacteria bacterium]|nr:AAA family ATPase [Deltaproteobacteria bacterium]